MIFKNTYKFLLKNIVTWPRHESEQHMFQLFHRQSQVSIEDGRRGRRRKSRLLLQTQQKCTWPLSWGVLADLNLLCCCFYCCWQQLNLLVHHFLLSWLLLFFLLLFLLLILSSSFPPSSSSSFCSQGDLHKTQRPVSFHSQRNKTSCLYIRYASLRFCRKKGAGHKAMLRC